MNTLAGILTGVGFLLVLIGFGARRKRSGCQKTRKKPETLTVIFKKNFK